VDERGSFAAEFAVSDGTYRARVPAAKGLALGMSLPLKVIRS
jgi:hypothetical protein